MRGEPAEGFQRVFRKAFSTGATATPHDAPAERAMPYQQEAPRLGESCCILVRSPWSQEVVFWQGTCLQGFEKNWFTSVNLRNHKDRHDDELAGGSLLLPALMP